MHRFRVRVVEGALDANDTIARANRADFDRAGVAVVNLMSAPGAGKTTLLERTLGDMGYLRVGVLEGDVQGSFDADRLARLHIPVTQINTGDGFGGECHLDANMVRSALPEIPLDEIDLLVVENVGNLVCPAEFRIGEDARAIVHDEKRWGHLREAARTKQLAEVPTAIYASDHDPAMVKIAQRTFQGAGVAIDIRLKQSDILDLDAPSDQGVMVINPPYGVRLSRPDELESFYPKLGDWLKQRFAGWRAYVLTGDARVPKLIGLAPSKRIPLFNGALECRLYEFLIVQGGARRRLAPPAQT